jgi:hypothetical protein
MFQTCLRSVTPPTPKYAIYDLRVSRHFQAPSNISKTTCQRGSAPFYPLMTLKFNFWSVRQNCFPQFCTVWPACLTPLVGTCLDVVSLVFMIHAIQCFLIILKELLQELIILKEVNRLHILENYVMVPAQGPLIRSVLNLIIYDNYTYIILNMYMRLRTELRGPCGSSRQSF